MVALLLAAGCARPSLTIYKDPVTQVRQFCVRALPAADFYGPDILDALRLPFFIADVVQAGNAYAECRTRLEQQGYVKE